MITDALIADLHTESIFLCACDCCLWGTLHSEDKCNDSKNDVIKIRNLYIYINICVTN